MSTWTESMHRRRRPSITRADVRAELDVRAAVVMDSRAHEQQLTVARQRAADAERRLVLCLSEPPVETPNEGRWMTLAFVAVCLVCLAFYVALWWWLLGPLPVTPPDWSGFPAYREFRP